jgi:transmembrane sensor
MEIDSYIELISKQLTGESTQKEDAQLNDWLVDSNENQATFDSYKKIWELSSLENDFNPDVDLAFAKFQSKIETKEINTTKIVQLETHSKKKYLKPFAYVAASLLFLFGISIFIRTNMVDEIISLATTNQQKEIQLPDGSKIWMNANSKIDYPSKFKTRNIAFEGEAFFEIKSNPSKPFTIVCKSSIVKVLGTSFNLNSIDNSSELEVVVSTGKVQLSSSKSDQIITLLVNEKGIINQETGEIQKLGNDSPNYKSWKTNQLIFNNETLEVLAQDLSNYFKIKIEVSKEIKDCRFTTEFNNPKLDEVLALFGNYYNIHKSNNDMNILISGTKCD